MTSSRVDFDLDIDLFFPMIPEEDILKNVLTRELFNYFLKEGFKVVAARDVDGFEAPPAFRNDGYGDQQPKRPDIVGYHPIDKSYMIGIARTGIHDFESESSLTEYNVFLDQRDKTTNEPFKLCIIAPASKLDELTTLITRYIHPDYYPSIVFLRSSKCD